MRVVDLKVNHLENPIGYNAENYSFSYKVVNAKGKKQISARIEIAEDENFEQLLLDTGDSAEISLIATELDVPVKPRCRYFWRVTVKSDANECAISEPAFFETGKNCEAWSGKWISSDKRKDEETGRQPIFEREFICDKRVKKARLYISGLGLYHPMLNGFAISNERLMPYCNNYNELVQYQTFDITNQMSENNKLSVIMGDGWYKGRFGYTNTESMKGHFGDDYKLIAEVHIDYEDGSTEVLCTDDSWSVRRSNITFSNIYDGEHRDDSLAELPKEQVRLLENGKYPVERFSIPVITHEELAAIELIDTPAGEKVFDLGQNMAGGFKLHINATKGTKVNIQFGEVLQQGNFYRDNLRTAKAEYIYISDGVEKDIEPLFTYFGYRYAKVEGLDNISREDFTGIAYYSDVKPIGKISTSDEKVNKLISNICWGQKSNFIDVPTDCPQRDERMGWTADTQVFAPTANYFTDAYAFYRKYLNDLRIEQKINDGAVPDVVPNFGNPVTNAAVWGDVATILPWTLYLYSGDKEILRESIDSMAAWVDKVTKIDGDSHNYRNNFQYGDWLALDNPSGSKDSMAGGTDVGFIGDIYHMYSAELTSKAAGIIGRDDIAEKYASLAVKLRQEIKDEYYSKNGRCTVNTMTAYLLSLRHNLSSNPDYIAEALVKLLMDNGNKLKTGFTGTPLLCPELTRAGRADLAYELLLNEDFPGWLYEVNLGATTVWERWNSMEADGTVSSTGMNSFNHYAYGSIAEWIWQTIGGISPVEDEPAFKKAYIKMIPHRNLTSAEAEYDSPSGKYKTSWKVLDNTHLLVKVSVPFDCTASLELYNSVDSELVKELTAGEYEFEYELASPLKEVYSIDSTMNDLRKSPKAIALLSSAMPEISLIPPAMYALSLRDIAAGLGAEISEEVIRQINQLLEAC